MNKFTITDFNNYKSQAKKITMITAYDFNHAQLIAESLIDTILVGDSGVGKTSVLVQFDQGKFQSGLYLLSIKMFPKEN